MPTATTSTLFNFSRPAREGNDVASKHDRSMTMPRAGEKKHHASFLKPGRASMLGVEVTRVDTGTREGKRVKGPPRRV